MRKTPMPQFIDKVPLSELINEAKEKGFMAGTHLRGLQSFLTENYTQNRELFQTLEDDAKFRKLFFDAIAHDKKETGFDFIPWLTFHLTYTDTSIGEDLNKLDYVFPVLLKECLERVPAKNKRRFLNTLNPLNNKTTVLQGVATYTKLDLLDAALEGTNINNMLTGIQPVYQHGRKEALEPARGNLGNIITIGFLVAYVTSFAADVVEQYYPDAKDRIELMGKPFSKKGALLHQIFCTEDEVLIGKFFKDVDKGQALHLLFNQTLGGDKINYVKFSAAQRLTLMNPEKRNHVLKAIFPNLQRDDSLREQVYNTDTGYSTISSEVPRYKYDANKRVFVKLQAPSERPSGSPKIASLSI